MLAQASASSPASKVKPLVIIEKYEAVIKLSLKILTNSWYGNCKHCRWSPPLNDKAVLERLVSFVRATIIDCFLRHDTVAYKFPALCLVVRNLDVDLKR